MNHSNLKKKFQCYFEKLLQSKAVQLITLVVKDYVTFEHQRVPTARFCCSQATYCYIQVDLKSFLASGAFFLGRKATEGARRTGGKHFRTT